MANQQWQRSGVVYHYKICMKYHYSYVMPTWANVGLIKLTCVHICDENVLMFKLYYILKSFETSSTQFWWCDIDVIHICYVMCICHNLLIVDPFIFNLFWQINGMLILPTFLYKHGTYITYIIIRFAMFRYSYLNAGWLHVLFLLHSE